MKSKWFIFLFALTVFSVNIFAQNGQPRPAKIEWYTSYDKAVSQSKMTDKPIILFFTGSDWCSWCQKLKSEVLDQQAFADSVADKFVFLKVDFPKNQRLPASQEREHHALKKKYGVRGFPTLIILDEKQQKINSVGYRKGGPQAYAEYLLKTLADYRSYEKDYSRAVNGKATPQELRETYKQACALGQEDDIQSLVNMGCQSPEPLYFLKEKFRFLVEAGQINTEEAQNIKKQVLALDSDNQSGARRNVAVIEFQRLAEELELDDDGDPAKACAPLLDYISQFGEKDKDHLWRMQMTVAQTFLSKSRTKEALDFAKASFDAAPELVRPEIACAIEQIENFAQSME